MPSTNNQALLLDLQVFLANNNIRRGVLSVAINATSVSNHYVEQTIDVPANDNKRFTCAVGNVCTIIRTTKPITVLLTHGADTSTFVINSLFVFTDTVDLLQFVNNSPTDVATLRLLQI